MFFFVTKAKEDIWIRKNEDIYKYIASYVDDLCIVEKKPEEIIQHLEHTCQYKLKETGPISFHLGCDYF